jgi:hypothetical protein
MGVRVAVTGCGSGSTATVVSVVLAVSDSLSPQAINAQALKSVKKIFFIIIFVFG